MESNYITDTATISDSREKTEDKDLFPKEQKGDIPEARRRIRELEESNQALKEALERAEAANAAKSTFLSSMSHDIRTPMNAILGMASIGLAHIDEKARVQDCLLKIQTASTHLMSLVNDVLDMSRIDSGSMTLNREEFALSDLVHDIAVIVRPQAGMKRQKLQMEIGHIYEENLTGDPLHLRQIMVNVIGNAVKYTQEEGNIRVSFSQRIPEHAVSDMTSLQQEDEMVILDFCCEDNGMGMSEEFLKKIFLPFERVQNDATSKIEGTGLGMTIVKNLISDMGGQIRVESREGEGSRFDIEIPIAVAPRNEDGYKLPVGMSVLVVENRSENVRQIEECLDESGLKIVHLRSGMEAVTWLTEAQYEERMPCAMLLGQELADMPVLELASHIRGLAGGNFPIILVSEADWGQIEYRASRAGVSAFVPCPLFKSRLLKTLSDLLGMDQSEEKGFAGGSRDYSRYRILLVEDNMLNQEIAVELLSATGVQIETADNGQQAVETFAASPEGYFDLIFMDVQMPVMNGYDATRKIRSLERTDAETVWIVAMTANAFVEDIRHSKEAGMNEHVSKPIDFERLQEILQKQFK